MADPRRLVDDPAMPELARSALASADDDRPSADSRGNAARKLGLVAGVAATVSGNAVASGGALWWKLGALVLLAGGATLGIVRYAGAPQPAQPPSTLAPAPAPATEPGPAVIARPDPAPPVAAPPVAAPPVAPPPVAPHRRPAHPAPQVAAAPVDSPATSAPELVAEESLRRPKRRRLRSPRRCRRRRRSIRADSRPRSPCSIARAPR